MHEPMNIKFTDTLYFISIGLTRLYFLYVTPHHHHHRRRLMKYFPWDTPKGWREGFNIILQLVFM